MVVKNDGTLWSWGHNDSGKLGQNNAVNYSSPTQIGTDNSWLINTGYHRGTVTVKSDGTMWTWGSGTYGALGHNNTTQYSSPKQVGTDTTWATGKNKFTSNGQTHAIKTDGTLWSWGKNNEGQLGQGNTTQYSSPKQVGTDTTWSHVQCCFRTTIATKTNGTLWSWGYNNQGEQGVNDRTQRDSPKQVGTDTTWDLSQTAIVSDNSIGCIKTDGTLWAWGYGGSGALGQNNIITRSSPCQIPGTSWRSAVIQQSTSAGTKTDGTLWTWGNNTNGQIGNNTQQPGDGHYSSPVQIPGTSWVNVNYNSQVMTASKSA